MKKGFTATASMALNATAAGVWKALTEPELIKKYMFGTSVTTDWQVGSPITYRGEWEGKPYEDKGTILEVVPEKRLVSTYWSSMSGRPDSPDQYMTVSYELIPQDGGTKLIITQDNNKTQADASHSEQNWNMVLDEMRKVIEAENAG
jgi:uncharacterized protein YndB with AHSA1/START domain